MSVTIGTVVISNDPEQESRFDEVKYSQKSRRLEDGSFETFASGYTQIEGVLVINNIKESEFINLRNYISRTVNFSRLTFPIQPPSFYDMGLGEGVEVTVNYIGSASTESWSEPTGKLRRWNVSLPYSFAKPIDPAFVNSDGVVSV